jgi:hypothetical protein
MPWFANVLKSVMSRMEDAISQEPVGSSTNADARAIHRKSPVR